MHPQPAWPTKLAHTRAVTNRHLAWLRASVDDDPAVLAKLIAAGDAAALTSLTMPNLRAAVSGTALDAACRILSLADQLAEAKRINTELRQNHECPRFDRSEYFDHRCAPLRPADTAEMKYGASNSTTVREHRNEPSRFTTFQRGGPNEIPFD